MLENTSQESSNIGISSSPLVNESGMSSDVKLTINGTTHTVPRDLATDLVLCDYLRDHLHLTGTKFMCREGICGACIVTVKKFNPIFKEERTISVNSCLLPLYACAGWNVLTIEGIGDSRTGYHPIQKRLAEYNGTQCGFCSPGMVMAMYSLLENQPIPKVQDVEDLLDGNLCRCTGYRPILDTLKSFSQLKANDQLSVDKESEKGTEISVPCQTRAPPIKLPIHLSLKESDWFRPMTLDELMTLIVENHSNEKTIRYVVGNTASGLFKDDGPYNVYIDLKGIQELYQCDLSDNGCILGANASLNDFIEILQRIEKNLTGFGYCGTVAEHIKLIGTNSVRNVGCWAGNLMIKKEHREFPSDLFTLLTTLEAEITLCHYSGANQTISPLELLDFDMNGWIILNLKLKPFTSKHCFQSFKIMPRSQSSQAYVNIAVSVKIDKSQGYKILNRPSIVFGGISPEFIHAERTETFLMGKSLSDPQILFDSLTYLTGELKPDTQRLIGSPAYRKTLGTNLFYKCILGIVPDILSSGIKNGAEVLYRPVSLGSQAYDVNTQEWPLYQPMPKLEAHVQCSGEAEYIMDIPKPPNTLYAAFVLSKVANANVKRMDFSEAQKIPGVVRIITAQDIPGENNIYPLFPGLSWVPEQLFCTGKILYAGQSLALIVADSKRTATNAAKLVKITYENEQLPTISMEEAIKESLEPAPKEIQTELKTGDTKGARKTFSNIIEGVVKSKSSQWHCHLETQVTLCIPTEDGMDVATSTQWLDISQQAIAQVLCVEKSRISVQVRRLGGAFGGKLTRNLFAVTGCALAAHLTNRPVFLHLDVDTNMELLGKRHRLLAKYQVGFDNDGKLGFVDIQYFTDNGCLVNDSILIDVVEFGKNVYECSNWRLTPQLVLTDTPSSTWVRAPGSADSIFVMETIMEHIAKFLNKDPIAIKEINMEKKSAEIGQTSIRDIYSQLKDNAEIEKRKLDIEKYNKSNRWKKKGLSIVPMKYDLDYLPLPYSVMVCIYRGGGSVAVTHGGVEMGQGINTKIAQVCARELDIPFSLISVKATNTFTNPNAFCTGGSSTSELNCMAAAKCCQILVSRMKPFKEKLKNASWKELVDVCFLNSVDLCARHMYGPEDKLQEYSIFGATAAEVEIDVLTGQHVIQRVDMLFDWGYSLNPYIDIGQIEGAFIMGIGHFLMENTIYDPVTGRNLTRRLFDYFVPSSKDIPAEFRITLLKNAPNQHGVLKSKAVGEPPLCMSSVVLFAIQSAIHSANEEFGQTGWIPLDAPATPEAILLACNVTRDQLVYRDEHKQVETNETKL